VVNPAQKITISEISETHIETTTLDPPILQTANSLAIQTPLIGEDLYSNLSDHLKDTLNQLDPERIEINYICESVLGLDIIEKILSTIANEVDVSARWHTRTHMNETLRNLIGVIDREKYILIQAYFIRFSKCHYFKRNRKHRQIPTQHT